MTTRTTSGLLPSRRMPADTDHELIAELRRGDEAAFVQLVSASSPASPRSLKLGPDRPW